jgi:hypothetical protein
MFQLPLDQGYAFFGCSNSSNSQQPPLLLLANERAVESTLVLPLAVACSRLFMEASSVSRTLAANALLNTSLREILLPPTPVAISDEYQRDWQKDMSSIVPALSSINASD